MDSASNVGGGLWLWSGSCSWSPGKGPGGTLGCKAWPCECEVSVDVTRPLGWHWRMWALSRGLVTWWEAAPAGTGLARPGLGLQSSGAASSPVCGSRARQPRALVQASPQEGPGLPTATHPAGSNPAHRDLQAITRPALPPHPLAPLAPLVTLCLRFLRGTRASPGPPDGLSAVVGSLQCELPRLRPFTDGHILRAGV